VRVECAYTSTGESSERLVVLFVNKKMVQFLDLIGKVKNKGVVVMMDMKGKWLTVVVNDQNDLTKSLWVVMINVD